MRVTSGLRAISVLIAVEIVSAVFWDEAYKTDFHHALLGIPPQNSTFFQPPTPESRSSLLYTQSSHGAVGAVNPRDGTLVWRVKTPEGARGRAGVLKSGKDDGTVISIYGETATCLDAQTGRQRWQRTTEVGDIPAISEDQQLVQAALPEVVSVAYAENKRYIIKHTPEEDSIHERLASEAVAAWPRKGYAETEGSSFQHGVSNLAKKPDGSFALRSALVAENGDWSLFQNGQFVWTRQEELSGVVAAEWADRTSNDPLIKEIRQEKQSDTVSAFTHRASRHLKLLTTEFPTWLSQLPGRISALVSGDEFESITFHFDKLLIIATPNGWMHALDVVNQGRLVWRAKVMELERNESWDVKGILYSKKKGEVSVVDSKGRSAVVEASSGTLVKRKKWVGRPVLGISTVQDATGEYHMIQLPHGGVPSPAQEQALNEQHRSIISRGSDGSVQGVRFEKAGDHWDPYRVWSFSAVEDTKIRTVTSRPSHDPVASIARTKGDRSVQYKYLNPNLLLVTSLSEPASNTVTATFTLLDGLTGTSLHQFAIPGVNILEPVTSTISENFIAISYSTTSAEQTGSFLSITELYESDVPDVRQSAIRGAGLLFKPTTYSQTYLLPEPLSHLQMGVTRQGITTRPLLARTKNTKSLVSIPRQLLSPFRPIGRDPSSDEQEEGLMRYQPVLSIHPSWIISHKRELLTEGHGSPSIIVSDTGLESTALVATFGPLDIFGTRIQPSRAFDQLGSGFGKTSLIGTITMCACGVYVLAPIVRKKGVVRGWSGK